MLTYAHLRYGESEIAELERKARQVKEELAVVEGERGGAGGGGEGGEEAAAAESPAKREAAPRQVVLGGRGLVDLGRGPKQLTRREELLNADPQVCLSPPAEVCLSS